MQYQDYYERLNVDKNATADEIKKSYRRLARKYHPDVSKEENAEEKFKLVKEAYEVLKDSEKRKLYDQMGQNPNGADFNPAPGFDYSQYQQAGTGQHHSHYDGSEFSDFFENMFGARGAGFRQQQPRDRRGEDAHVNLNVSLREAFNGDKRAVQLQEPITGPDGQVRYETKKLNIKIPAGVTNGQKIRLKGQGSPGIGKAASGDLYITINLDKDPYYEVDGKNILSTLRVTPWEAALGAEITCPTLGGDIKLKVAQDSQSGKKLRLKGRGLPGKTPGDQIVTIEVILPKADSDKAKALYKQMAEELDFNPRQ